MPQTSTGEGGVRAWGKGKGVGAASMMRRKSTFTFTFRLSTLPPRFLFNADCLQLCLSACLFTLLPSPLLPTTSCNPSQGSLV